MLDYPPEQLWPLYEKLPQELQKTIFSEKTADTIYEIGNRNGLEKEKISELAKYIGYVILGLLPIEEFQETLVKELNLENDLAKKVAHEITCFIFFPIKESLEVLYKMEITLPKTEITSLPETEPSTEKPQELKKDIYRESIE